MNKRVVDTKTLQWVMNERDRMCLFGFSTGEPCSTALHVHHIEKRSQGGDDVPENLITLCMFHHERAHRGMIRVEEFQQILTKIYGYGATNG